MKYVTEKEFKKYLEDYPKSKLKSHLYTLGDPMQIHYYDETLAPKWPDFVVAWKYLERDLRGGVKQKYAIDVHKES